MGALTVGWTGIAFTCVAVLEDRNVTAGECAVSHRTGVLQGGFRRRVRVRVYCRWGVEAVTHSL